MALKLGSTVRSMAPGSSTGLNVAFKALYAMAVQRTVRGSNEELKIAENCGGRLRDSA